MTLILPRFERLMKRKKTWSSKYYAFTHKILIMVRKKIWNGPWKKCSVIFLRQERHIYSHQIGRQFGFFCPLSGTTIPDSSNIPTSSKLPRGKSLEVESHYVLLEQKLQFDLKCWQHLTFVYRNHHTNVASVLVTCTICNGEIPKTRDS